MQAAGMYMRNIYNDCSARSYISHKSSKLHSHNAFGSSFSKGILPQPSIQNLACMAENCTAAKNLTRALCLHTVMHRIGLSTHTLLGNFLVSVFIEAGSLRIAQNVFDVLVFKSEYAWNSLITNYIAYGESKHAFSMYERMRQHSLHPCEHTFLALLKACIKQKDVDRGCRIHTEIVKKGFLKKNAYLGNMLVDMYAKCGSLVKAQEVFDMLPNRDVVAWTALMAGYAHLDHCEEALHLFEEMQVHGISPNAYTFACSLKSCASIGALNTGIKLHVEIARQGLLHTSEVLGCTLVDMYAKCGMLAKAQEVFDTLPFRDVVLWTALIAGYTQHEHGDKALKCFQQMQLEGVTPNALTFASSVKACGSIGALNMGIEIHTEISRKGLLDQDHVLGSALVDMYAKCGFLGKAQELFGELVVRDTVSWNALIAGYVHHGHGEEALQCFEEMQSGDVTPDAITFAFALNACASIEDVIKGKEIHAEISKTGLLGKHLVLGNSLVAMYAKSGMLANAQEVLDELPVRDVVSWTALISGFTEHEYSLEALNCFKQMQLESVLPDLLTFACSLRACGISGLAEKGIQIHSQIAQKGFLQNDEALGNALLGMYAKVGMLSKAQETFDELRVQDVVSWTALIAGYTEHNLYEEALNCYRKMQQKGVAPDAITFTCILQACGSIGDIDQGKEIHAEIHTKGLLKNDFHLGNALVDMYAKCGMLAKAQEVFDNIQFRDVVSWTALITGYAQQGHTENVLRVFDSMRAAGEKPNSVTFVSVLSACSHAGLVEKGEVYFDAMINEYGIAPTLEHHTCVVDLLGRAGQLEKAIEMMKKTPSHPNIEMWLTILGACQKWVNVDLGRHAFEQVVLLNEKETSAYICMYNIFAHAGMWEDANKVEALRVKNHAPKKPGLCCWVDVTGLAHAFLFGVDNHCELINAKLENLSPKMQAHGYDLWPRGIFDARNNVLCGQAQ